MSSISVIYADADDHTVRSQNSSSANVHEGATLGLNVAGSSFLFSGSATNSTTSWECYESFIRFDASGVSSGTAKISLWCSAAGNNEAVSLREKSWSSPSTANWVAASALTGLTLVDTVTPVASAWSDYPIGSFSGGGFLSYLTHGARQLAGTFNSGLSHPTFSPADATGTTNDPKLTVISGDQVTYVGAGAVNSNAAAATYVVPAGIANNDILLLVVEIANDVSSLTFTAGTGWALLGTSGVGTAGGTAATRVLVYWKRTTGSETNPTIADPGNHQIGAVFAFRGCVTSGDPWDVIGSATTGTTASVTIPGVTTSVAGCMVVDLLASGADVTTAQCAFTEPTGVVGFEEIADSFTNTQNGGGIGVAIAYKETAGAVGTTAVTLTTANSYAAFKIALKPEASGPPTSTGTATGSIAFTGAAAGTSPRNATASGTIALTGTSAGKVQNNGTASGSIAFTGTAEGSGATVTSGTASGSIDLTGAASGVVPVQGEAAGSFDLTGAADGTVSGGATFEFLRPDGIISAGSWTGDNTAVDEATPDDDDLAYSQDNPNGSIFELSLSNPTTTPGTGTTTVRYRHAQVSSGTVDGGGTATALNVSVIEGTTTIAADAEQAPSGTWTTREWTPDLSGVTDWTDLRLRFTATGGGGSPANRRGVGISWAEVETPQGTATTSGTASGSFGIAGTAEAISLIAGSAAGDISLSGASAGAVAIVGTATGEFTLTGAATGDALVSTSGSASGGIDLTGSTAGTVAVQGAASGSLDLTGTSAGTVPAQGTATGGIGFTGTATGAAQVKGTASGEIAFTGDAAATVLNTGTATGEFTLTGEATGSGVLTTFGTAAGEIEFTGSATAAVSVTGSASGEISLTGASVATNPIAGATSGDFALTGATAGTVAISGAAGGSIEFTGAAEGTVATASTSGTAAGSIDLAGSGTGAVAIVGTVTGAISLTGSVVGQQMPATQFLRPDGNITQTGFTGGFAEIDETSASDADFAYGANNTAAVLEVSLSDPAYLVAAGGTVRYRIAKTNAGVLSGTGNAVSITATVYQGTTLIATDTARDATGTWTTYTWTPDFSAVTDWNDVRLRFTTTASAGTAANRRGGAVSWAEVELATAAATVAGTASGSFALTGAGAGKVAILAAGSGAIAFEGAGAGTVATAAINGTAAGSLAITGSTRGSAKVQGDASGALEIAGAASGGVETPTATGSASGSFDLGGAAQAVVTITATGAGLVTFTGSAAAAVRVVGSAQGDFGLGGYGAVHVGIIRTPTASRPTNDNPTARPAQSFSERPEQMNTTRPGTAAATRPRAVSRGRR